MWHSVKSFFKVHIYTINLTTRFEALSPVASLLSHYKATKHDCVIFDLNKSDHQNALSVSLSVQNQRVLS